MIGNEDKIIIQTAIRGSTKIQLKQICAKKGMTQIAVFSRLVDWFAEQDATLQSLILERFEDVDQVQIAKIVLSRIIGKRASPPTKLRKSKR